MKKRRLKKRYILILLLLLILGYCGYNKIFKKPENVPINFYQVTKKDEIQSYNFSGLVTSDKTVSVYSTVSGKVNKIYKREWDSVNKGDVLLDINQDSISSIQNNIDSASIRLKSAKDKYEMSQKLYDNGLISKNDLEDAKQNYELNNLSYKEYLNKAKDISLKVTAPISGVITELNADENFSISESKALYKISDTVNLSIKVEVPNSQLKYIKVGNSATVTSNSLPDGTVLNGVVESIEKIAYSSKQYSDTLTNVYIRLDNNSTLKPGEIVNVNIVYNVLKNELLVPNNYILLDENSKPYVMIDENGIAKRAYVELGERTSTSYAIKSGLDDNAILIDNSSHTIKEGDKVRDNSQKSS